MFLPKTLNLGWKKTKGRSRGRKKEETQSLGVYYPERGQGREDRGQGREDRAQKEGHHRVAKAAPVEPPLIVVSIVGLPKIGKTTLLTDGQNSVV
jgi:hypothetical protein